MALQRTFVRQLTVAVRSCVNQTQKRNAQVHDVRFFALHAQRQNKYVDKYKGKLEKKAREIGAKDADDLVARVKTDSVQAQQSQTQQQEPDLTSASHLSSASSQSHQDSPEGQIRKGSYKPHPDIKQKPAVKTLSSFLDVGKVTSLPSTEIEALWRLRHASNLRSLCATIPGPLFARIALTARKHPQFILPIPRTAAKDGDQSVAGEIGDGSGGADIHFLQWTFPSPTTVTVLFTHLAEYKTRGEYAAPHTTITHHTDLALDKGLVLLEGSVMPDRGVSVDEGKWLVMCLQKFYGAFENESESMLRKRTQLLEQFSNGDANFEVAHLLDETEKLG